MSALAIDTPRRVLEFTRTSTRTPQQARRWAAGVLGEQHAPAEAVATTELVVTELVTNAALHGPADSRILVSLARVEAGIEVRVYDEGRIPPEQWDTSGGLDAESGRGLSIVRALSLRFAVEVHQFAGKTAVAVIA